jgi:hypothetical protein
LLSRDQCNSIQHTLEYLNQNFWWWSWAVRFGQSPGCSYVAHVGLPSCCTQHLEFCGP